MRISLTPLLLAAQLGFLLAVTHRIRAPDPDRLAAGRVYGLVAWIGVYASGTAVLGAAGLFVSEALLPFLPALWLQVLTVAACVVPVVASRELRESLRAILDRTPWSWFAGLQALRISALGTAFKTWAGEFPVYFELLVGVPDLAFGLSAVWVARRAARGQVSARTFLRWNLLGALVIVPGAPLLLQLGLPGPLQVFPALPDARAVFTWPMALAPMVVVPLFVLLNLGVAWRLWESARASGHRRRDPLATHREHPRARAVQPAPARRLVQRPEPHRQPLPPRSSR